MIVPIWDLCKRYAITHCGAAIADLVPTEAAGRHGAAEAVDQMTRCMAENPLKGVNIKALINAGRR